MKKEDSLQKKYSAPLETIEPQLINKMEQGNIDIFRTCRFMEKIKEGLCRSKEVEIDAFPEIDNKQIVELRKKCFFEHKSAQHRFNQMGLNITIADYGVLAGDKISFTYEQLEKLGAELAPFVAYGILNGGTASSYYDSTKNQKLHGKELYKIYTPLFTREKERCQSLPKACVPCYFQPDGEPGSAYLALKIRALLIKSYRYMKRHGLKQGEGANLYQIFQMDSVANSKTLAHSLQEYSKHPILQDLISYTGIDLEKITREYTKHQPFVATFNLADGEANIFVDSQGQLYPMPAGHGHNYEVLKSVYRRLYCDGKRFVYLCNIDNMGNIVDDAMVAYLALSNHSAAFEFTKKTSIDKKGGIAVISQGKLNCADIGMAVSQEQVQKAEQEGKTILFNAATGLFNLQYLNDNIGEIIENLPLRISTQHKDIGSYCQVEQSAWEIISILDNPLIFAVEKQRRFLAAKTFIEGAMASDILTISHQIDSLVPTEQKQLISYLQTGMKKLLTSVYGMKYESNRWQPKSLAELENI